MVALVRLCPHCGGTGEISEETVAASYFSPADFISGRCSPCAGTGEAISDEEWDAAARLLDVIGNREGLDGVRELARCGPTVPARAHARQVLDLYGEVSAS